MTAQTQSAADKRKNLETILPLAPLQEGILFHCLTEPDAGTYMPQIAFHLEGTIDRVALKTCWQQIIDRHQLLRAGIHWEERDDPFQVIYRHIPLDWTELDWSSSPDETHQDKMAELYASNRATPFDLRRPPLLRLFWITLGKNRNILVICHHHIILDGWSTSQMLREAFALYHQTAGAGLPPARPYGEYVKWLKTRDQGASASYWESYLDGSPGPSPVFGAPPAAHDFARTEWPFPAELVSRITTLLSNRGITLSTLLHGVLGLQIARHLDRDDVFFGSATAGRPASLPGSTGMVGLFINALPVRVRFNQAQPVSGWLSELQRQQAATMEHEYVALRQIQQNRGTLFDCLLVIENYPTSVGDTAQSDIRLARIEFDEWTHFPLTLLVATGHSDMKLILRHDRNVLPPETLDTFVIEFTELLGRIVDEPDTPIRDLIGPVAKAAPIEEADPQATTFVAPATDTEKVLAEIWSEVLRRDQVGAGDNFFETGGHSLLAVKVVTRLRSALDLEIPVRALFDRPTLSELATYVDALRATKPLDGASPELEMEF